MNGCLFTLGSLFICLLFACSPAPQKTEHSFYTPVEKKIDSLLALELFKEAQNNIYTALGNTSYEAYASLPFLYSRLSRSYKLSYHYDSAVHYAEMAYDISLKWNDQQQQTAHGAYLLNVYNKSAKYIDGQQKMFQVLHNRDISEYEVPVQASVTSALTEYYQRNLRFNGYLELPIKALDLYKEYRKDNVLTYEDSVNIGLFCIDLSKAYAMKDFSEPADSNVNRKKNKKQIYYFNEARKWIGNHTYPLAMYYSLAIHISFIEDDLEMRRPYLYLDSLLNMAKTTGLNLNDLIIQAHINLCDNYFYFLEDNKENNRISRKLVSDAGKYDHALIDPSVNYYLQWLSADLLMREKKYDSALLIFNDISRHLSKYFQLRQQLTYVLSVADCYEGYGEKDSTIAYHKLYAKLLDSLLAITENKTIKEAETNYQNNIKQNKINTQDTIIQYANKQKFRLIIGMLVATGSIVFLVFLYRKINKQNEKLRHLNQQLGEANKTKAKLFAIISHDFRSPVNHVYQLLKLQRSKEIMIDADEKAALERQTQAATSHLLESMEELLIWSKTQMQEFHIVREKVNIKSLCNHCVDLLQPLILEKEINLRFEINERSYELTDTNFLMTILRNLLQNAIKASPQKGNVIIRYKNTGNASYLRIMNEGAAFTQQNYMEAITHTASLLKGGLGLMIVDELSRKIDAAIFFGVEGKFTYCDVTFHTGTGNDF